MLLTNYYQYLGYLLLEQMSAGGINHEFKFNIYSNVLNYLLNTVGSEYLYNPKNGDLT